MLICFSGKSGAGKTTAALHLAGLYGGVKMALGDAVKEEVLDFIQSMDVWGKEKFLWGSQEDKEQLLNVTVEQWTLADYRPRRVLAKYMTWVGDGTISISYRLLLQVWGTEYRRDHFGQDYWINRLCRKLKDSGNHIFVDDVRFPDEAQLIKDLGGILVRISRPDASKPANHTHDSETALDKYNGFDWNVINAGTIEEFYNQVEAIARWLA